MSSYVARMQMPHFAVQVEHHGISESETGIWNFRVRLPCRMDAADQYYVPPDVACSRDYQDMTADGFGASSLDPDLPMESDMLPQGTFNTGVEVLEPGMEVVEIEDYPVQQLDELPKATWSRQRPPWPNAREAVGQPGGSLTGSSTDSARYDRTFPTRRGRQRRRRSARPVGNVAANPSPQETW